MLKKTSRKHKNSSKQLYSSWAEEVEYCLTNSMTKWELNKCMMQTKFALPRSQVQEIVLRSLLLISKKCNLTSKLSFVQCYLCIWVGTYLQSFSSSLYILSQTAKGRDCCFTQLYCCLLHVCKNSLYLVMNLVSDITRLILLLCPCSLTT